MIIYLTENLINNNKYIGQDSRNNPKYLGSGKYLKLAIKKYGKNNFKKTILEICNNKAQLHIREKYWIKKYNAVESTKFYNISEGGTGGWLGEKADKKRRESLKGHKHSEYTKNKIREKAIGRKASKVTRDKMSKSQLGIERHKNRDKISSFNNANAKIVAQYNLNSELIKVWDCIRDAAKKFNIKSQGNITGCINGTRKTAGGFIWKSIN